MKKNIKKPNNNNGVNTIVNKDDIVELTIEDIGSDGEGIGRIEGYTLFVKDALVGDKITAKNRHFLSLPTILFIFVLRNKCIRYQT